MYDKQNIFWNMHMTLGTNLRITRTSKFTLACTFITYEAILWKSDSTALTNSECLHKVSYHCSPIIPPLSLHTYAYNCMCTCSCMHMCVCACVNVYVWVCEYVFTCLCTHVGICIGMQLYVLMYISCFY